MAFLRMQLYIFILMAGKKNQLLIHDWKAFRHLWLSHCSQKKDLLWYLLQESVEPLEEKAKMTSLQQAWHVFSVPMLLSAQSSKYQHLHSQIASRPAELVAKHFLRVCLLRLNFFGNYPVSESTWGHSIFFVLVGVLMKSLPSIWLLSTFTELIRSLVMLKPLTRY